MWERKRLNVPIDASRLNVLVDSIVNFGEGINTSLSTLVEALNLVKLFLVDDPSNLSQQIYNVLYNVIESTINSNYSACLVVPTIENQYTTGESLDLLATSVIDLYDDNRPIKDVRQNVLMFIVAVESGTYTGLMDILNLVNALIELPNINFEDEHVVTPGESVKPSYGQSEFPDWHSGKIKNISPVVYEVGKGLESALNLFGSNQVNNSDLISSAVSILDEKLIILNDLINTIDTLVNSYLDILNIGDLLVYKISGTYSAGELQGQILKAKEELELMKTERQEYIETYQIDTPMVSVSTISEINKPQESDNVGAIFAFSFNVTNTEIGNQVFGG